MSFELNFEQLKSKLKKVLDPSRFRFVVILYPSTNTIEEIKNHISDTYPESLITNLNLQNKSYQDISNQLYKNNEGFVYINDFEEILNNPELYNGFNQRRDKIASHNINLICFISLYRKEELFTKALNVIPDLWEFKDTVLELQKDKKTDELRDINYNHYSEFSSFGGLTTKDKKIELNKLLIELGTVDNDELRLNLLYQIATIYSDIGESSTSLEYFIKELKLKEKLQVSENIIANSYNNISTAYRAIGKLDKALTYQRKALKIIENNLEKNDLLLAKNYNNISLVYLDLGDLEKALEYQLKSLKIREEVLGDEDNSLAANYSNTAAIYQSMKKFKQAFEYQKKALKIVEEIFGENHPYLAQVYSNIGTIYHDMGEMEKALEYQLKSLKIREEVLGDVHPNLANSYNNLSMIYVDIKYCKKAKEFLLKSINILSQLNYKHPHLITLSNNLKLIESQIKKQEKAGYKKKGKYCKDM